MNSRGVALAVFLLGAAGCALPPAPAAPAPAPVVSGPPLQRFDYEEVHFGNVPVQLCLYAPDAAVARAAATAAFARIAELTAMMNDYAYDPPSPLNRIAAEAPAPVPVPPELFAVLARSIEIQHITKGAFDVTIKPYVQLWRVSRRLGELPPPEQLRKAARYVDITALQLDAAASTARLAKEGMWLDVGGIAKGYVGDEVVRLLRARGLPNCSYHAGGDMVFGEAPPGEPGWPVEVPDFPGEGGLHFLVHDEAVSVSGDVFRFFEIDGRRYAHVIDPRTGLGVTERRIVCVRGPRGLDTDPLSTAGMILDEVEWRAALAQVPGCSGQVARIAEAAGAGAAARK